MNINFSIEVLYLNIDLLIEVAHLKVDWSSSKKYIDYNMNINFSLEVTYLNFDFSTLEETSEDFSIESLLQRVDEFQKREQLETLWRLTIKNSLLQKHITCYQEN